MLGRALDPIAAIATAPGRGAVGIVRVSGRGLGPLIAGLTGAAALRPREARYGSFLAADGSVIDRGLALFFPAPHSYTGEDVLELQAHGGPVILQLLLARCLELGAAQGLRLAEPGEFTRRAFLNDKLDLAQAEAVADLIDASTEAAARSAARSLAGEFSGEVHALRDGLIELRMLVEATLDFPEEDIDHLARGDAWGRLERLQARLTALFARARQGALLREGIHVVIAGQPNAGKSSLLNALAGAELAIVTPIAGTTRDKVAQTLQIEGVPLHVVDTAGLRETEDPIERIGIERAWDEIARADAIVFMHDLARSDDLASQAADAALQARMPAGVPCLHVHSKADLVDAATGPADSDWQLRLSNRTGAGLERLRERLLALAGWQALPEGGFIARERHLQALTAVAVHLQAAQAQLDSPAPALDLMAEELRLAQQALAAITGEFSADDLLGEIFSRFCIGK